MYAPAANVAAAHASQLNDACQERNIECCTAHAQEEVDSAPSSEAIPDRLQRQHQLRPSTSAADEDEPLPVLCARCHSLRHYG